MRAIIYNHFQETPYITNVADAQPSETGVVIKVEATGICRSDWHGWMGHDKDISLPHVPGHEFAGTIAETGKLVNNWKIGDRVTVPFVCGCGSCPECYEGNQQVCRNQFQAGFTHWGSFAEYVAIDFAETNLVNLPTSISFESAASLGCRFATSFRAVVDQAQLKNNQWITVFGCGGVGLSAIMIANAIGGKVIAIDINSEALSLAKKCGAEILINANNSTDLIEEILDLTHGGVHVSLDALGNQEIIRNSILCLKPRGKHIQIGILPPKKSQTLVPMDRIIAYELELLGSHGMQAYRYTQMLDMIQDGTLKPELLIQKKISLEEAIPILINMGNMSQNGITVVNS